MIAMNQVIILFIIIILGYIVKKLHIVKDSVKKDISNLIVNVALPAFIFVSMTAKFSLEIIKSSAILLVISFSMYIVAIFFGKIFTKIFKSKEDESAIFKYIIAFSNCGFMGYPVIDAVLGSQGVFYAAVFNLGFTTFVWTYGVSIIKGHRIELKNIKGIIKSVITPPFIALIIGFLSFALQIKYPVVLMESLKLVGGMTSPLSMMFIGFVLAEVEIKEMFSGYKIYIVALIRLIILPIILLYILKTIGLEGYLLKIPVIIAAMPAAANTAILSSKYNGNYKLASKGIFITTLISIITIPFILSLIL